MFIVNKRKRETVVYTNEELKNAIKNGEKRIQVAGELASKLKWIVGISPAKIVALTMFLAGTTIPNPMSGVSALATTGIVGTEIALIIFTSGVSISLILAILQGYDAEIDGKDGNKVILKSK